MEVHCPWAPVIEIQQPLIIKPPTNITVTLIIIIISIHYELFIIN